jgi:F-type H+-transporting ATPase subunit epsilon
MRLRITDPGQTLVDVEVASVTAEDASGSFGILPGHADFLTALELSVVSWREPGGTSRCCAVRNGILTVSGGDRVEIATREGHLGDDLAGLRAAVVAAGREAHEGERAGRVSAAKLRTQAIRRMVEVLRGGGLGGAA